MPDFARYLNIRSATSPVVSPDGTRVAFLSDITGNYQVWSVSRSPGDGNWPRQLTFFADKVWELHSNPTTHQLIAVSDVGGNERQQFYLVDGYGSDERGHEIRRLTQDDDAIHRFGAWSRDGRRILYTQNARNGVDFDLYVMDVSTGDAGLVCQMGGNRSVMAWSPDGAHVLVEENVGPLQIELFLIQVQTGEERHLTGGQSAAVYTAATWSEQGLYLISDRIHDRGAVCRLDLETGELTVLASAGGHDEDGEMELLAVDGRGTRAAYAYNAEGFSQLWLLDLESGHSRYLPDVPPGQISHLEFAENNLVFDLMGPAQPSDIWEVDLNDMGVCRLSHSDLAGIPRTSFVSPALIHYESFDGLRVPGFYYRPQDPPPEAGYPCILYVHGGPTSQLRPDFDVRFQYFLSRGYAILGPNVRGSTGYGRAYAALDEVEKRMQSVRDLKYAVDWLHSRTEIDSGRIGIYGRSYGGFMVLAALTEYPELFAAGIDVVGIANWVSFLERTSAWRRSHREEEYGSLTHDRELLERISPIHKADRIQMPLLVIAGDNDPRVPLYESELVVERVRQAGGTVEFLHYADEGHKISKLANRIHSFSQMADFLDRVL